MQNMHMHKNYYAVYTKNAFYLLSTIYCQYFAISPAIQQLHAYTQKHIIIGVATHAIIMQAQNVKI